MPKRAIPPIPATAVQQGRAGFDAAIKEGLEIITGQRGGKIAKLDATATTAQIVDKVNEIIERLQ